MRLFLFLIFEPHHCILLFSRRNAYIKTLLTGFSFVFTNRIILGIISLDMCRFNDQKRHMSRVVPLMLHRLSGEVRTERMDEQSYWLYEFPDAA